MCLCSAVKVASVDPKSRLRDISREIAQKAGEMRGTPVPRKDSERSGQRRPESRYRGTESHTQKANSPLQPLRNRRDYGPASVGGRLRPSCSSDLSVALCVRAVRCSALTRHALNLMVLQKFASETNRRRRGG